MKTSARKLMMAGLLAAFGGQTALVYADSTADGRGTLDDLALEGRAIWHRENCQTCHQIYGFGGFLGPDLTNAASRVNRERLEHMLTHGSQQMPKFGMSTEEIDAVEAYLVALDRTGRGQARAWGGLSCGDVLSLLEAHCGENPMDDEATRGFETFRVRCSACHTPFQATPLGPFLAADLSTVAKRLDRESLERTLVEGRPVKGMPPTGCSATERQELIAFFTWLADQEPVLRPRADAARVHLGLPWFEFR